MIYLKNSEQIALMREPNRIVKNALELAEQAVKPGVTTEYLDKIVYDYITKENAYPSFLNYNGFPKSICASIDDEVVHGIPSSKRVLHEGSIISIDIGAYKNGFHGDAARTFAVGKISAEKQKLIDVTKQSFFEAAKIIKEGIRLGDIGHAIDSYVTSFGYSTVKVLVGHGIGKNLHEMPDVPNYGKAGRGVRLVPGMTIAIEPMINEGTAKVKVMPDGWTVKTVDGSLSAHFEHTIAVTTEGPVILTARSCDW